jgi:hypothetical protein
MSSLHEQVRFGTEIPPLPNSTALFRPKPAIWKNKKCVASAAHEVGEWVSKNLTSIEPEGQRQRRSFLAVGFREPVENVAAVGFIHIDVARVLREVHRRLPWQLAHPMLRDGTLGALQPIQPQQRTNHNPHQRRSCRSLWDSHRSHHNECLPTEWQRRKSRVCRGFFTAPPEQSVDHAELM